MKLKEIIRKWRYLGYDKEKISRYQDIIDRDNFKILRDSTLIIGIIYMLVTIFFFVRYNLVIKGIMTFIMSIFLISCYIFSAYTLKKGINISGKIINSIILITCTLCYIACIYLGTFEAENDLAVAIIFTFLFVQIVFNLNPLQNMISIPCAIIFIYCSYITKDSVRFTYDTIHTIIVIIIGMFISWNKSRLKIDYIIANVKLNEKNKVLYYVSTTDELTGIYNRRKIFEILENIKVECIKENKKMVCLVMDIDDFKSYNDIYGHPAGDRLLNMIGSKFKDYAYENSIDIGRIGGEEFLAVWKERNEESANIDGDFLVREAKKIAYEISMSIAKLEVKHKGSSTSKIVTISQGICIGDSKIKVENIYSLADKQLYIAKNSGKNKLSI